MISCYSNKSCTHNVILNKVSLQWNVLYSFKISVIYISYQWFPLVKEEEVRKERHISGKFRFLSK